MSTSATAQINKRADTRTRDAPLSDSTFSGRGAACVPELDGDAIGAVLGAIAETCDDPEAAARAAATWTVLSRAHRDACHGDERVWRALLERHFPERVRFVSENTNPRLTFYSLCDTVRAYREGRLTLRTACDTHKRVKAFVLAALRHNGNGLCDLDNDAMRADRDVIVAATQGRYVLHRRDIMERFRDDREVVLGIVRWNGRALEYVSRRLRDDREVILAAVHQSGFAHMYASPRLFRDPEVVKTARKTAERSKLLREEWRRAPSVYGF
jgi:hypothetical protein